MHHIDPNQDRDPVADPLDPVVPVTPVVNTTTGPMTPVIVDTVDRSPNPMPWVAALLLAVLGVWGLMAWNEDERQPQRVTYVQQQLNTPSPFAERAPMEASKSRIAEDKARDNMAALRRQEMSRSLEADRLGDSTAADQDVTADYADDVASVDLAAAEMDRAPAEIAPPALVISPATDDVTPEIAVLDLDYSNQAVTAMNEQDVAAALTQLDADIDATEAQAKEHEQSAGLEVLEERLDALEDQAERVPSPMVQADLQMLTRQLKELRDELSAFQSDLASLK